MGGGRRRRAAVGINNGGVDKMKQYALFVNKGCVWIKDEKKWYAAYNPVLISEDLDEIMREKEKYNDVFVTEIIAI